MGCLRRARDSVQQEVTERYIVIVMEGCLWGKIPRKCRKGRWIRRSLLEKLMWLYRKKNMFLLKDRQLMKRGRRSSDKLRENV